ncbi:MAG: creatininase family protein [Anaerolineaceae bacterium]|nr:creatininase family protein [Anaerolineaceae bacterium]
MKLEKGKLENKWPLFLSKMTTHEIVEALDSVKIAILVVGSIEQHGAHLPINTDFVTAEYVVLEGLKIARSEISHPVAFIAPGIPYGGPGLGMTEWPGTLCVRPTVLIDFVSDVCGGLVVSGFKYIVIVNGCVGNVAALALAVKQLKNSNPTADFILVETACPIADFNRGPRESEPNEMGHADEFETSIMLVIDPKHVYMEKAVRETINHPSPEVSWDYGAVNRFFWPEQFKKMTKSGVIGNPTLGTLEKGEVILKGSAMKFADILLHIHGL